MSSSLESVPSSPLLPIATGAAWLCILTIGILGLRLPYPRPQPAPPPLQTQAQLVKVDLTPTPAPAPPPQPVPDQSTPTDDVSPPSPLPPPTAIPQAPAITPVAAPSAAIAFALPTTGLTKIVDINQAAHTAAPIASTTARSSAPTSSAPPAPPAAAPPPVIRLTFGQGEGNQPPPDYPREAALAGQQGTVTVRLNVTPEGRVSSAQIASPSPWPLLNQSALRTVKETWRFPPGPPRIYEVPIQFQLH